jgi:hypothetical protein
MVGPTPARSYTRLVPKTAILGPQIDKLERPGPSTVLFSNGFQGARMRWVQRGPFLKKAGAEFELVLEPGQPYFSELEKLPQSKKVVPG